MALTTTSYETHPFPLTGLEPPLPPPPAVAITPCDPWPRPYYLENGLRRVAPYHFTYNTFCKQRWRGREILDIFAKEFRDRSEEYYRNAIEEGHIVINGKPCTDVHTIVNNGDVISHTLHRHEPPVTAHPIGIISETDAMIVIDKPAGVPVHPAGRYKYNSVVEIMRAERHYSFNPLPCNRLDRLTSGVMFVGKTSEEAEVISEKLRSRTMRKEYVARVKGRFPDGEGWIGGGMRGGVVKCEENILQISPILGLNRARASGKTAKTLFRRVAYYPGSSPPSVSNKEISSVDTSVASRSSSTAPNPDSIHPTTGTPSVASSNSGYSIVHCLPLTGRTHQIRVHLQFLGHPISNDPIYSNRRVFGPTLAQHDSSPAHDAAIIERLAQMGKTEIGGADDEDFTLANCLDQTRQTTVRRQQTGPATPTDGDPEPTGGDKPLNAGTMHAGPAPTSAAEFAEFAAQHADMVSDYNRRKGEKMTGEKCDVCATDLYSDPGEHELGIYLHALAYADVGGEWAFRSPVPVWARRAAGFAGATTGTTAAEVDGLDVSSSPGDQWPTEIGEWEYDDVSRACVDEWARVDREERDELSRDANRRGEERNKSAADAKVKTKPKPKTKPKLQPNRSKAKHVAQDIEAAVDGQDGEEI